MNVWILCLIEFYVIWKDVFDVYKNGIIKGFKMYYMEIVENGFLVIMEIFFV